MSNEPTLFDWEPPLVPSPPKEKAFNGPAYVPEEDHDRLRGQLLRIFECMSDGKERSLGQIEDATGDPQASISAQLRHLRKEKYGSHTVLRISKGGGLHHYRLIVNDGADDDKG
jgi:hypothetical protein